MILWLSFVLFMKNYDSISLCWVSAFHRHPDCWILITNSRDIPLLRYKNIQRRHYIFEQKMTFLHSFVLAMKNYDSISLSWVSAFHKHPKCWILITNSRDIPLQRSKIYDDNPIFWTKNDFVALLWACHEKLRLYQLVLSVSFPQTP